MSTEQVIICGGLKQSGLPVPTGTLNLWTTAGKTNVRLSIADLNAKFCRIVPAQFYDLLEIATYIFTGDQMVSRGGLGVDDFGDRWRRQFDYHIPVREPDLWNLPAVNSVLRETVEFLSDDFYRLNFYPGTEAPSVQGYFQLDDSGAGYLGPEQVVMFSGGLDSLAGAIEESIVNKRRVALVNHRSTVKFNRTHAELQRLLSEKAGMFQPRHLRVEINKDGFEATDHNQRVRSLLYVALGGTVAMMLGLRNLRFYENGILSVNLPICGQLIGARATRTTHPRVLAGFQKLLTLLSQQTFIVENPFIWQTKGDIVKRIIDAGCGSLMPFSRSCAHTWQSTNDEPQCGTCSQCLDRRLAVLAAGAEQNDPLDRYKIDVFTQARPSDEHKILGAGFVERANQIAAMQDGSEFLSRYPEVLRALPFLGPNSAAATEKVFTLYKRHAAEVKLGIRRLLEHHAAAILERTSPADSLLRSVCESGSVICIPVPADDGDSAKPDADKPKPRFVFRKAGSHWDVAFDGAEEFHLGDSLGVKYLDYLLHRPNEPISAYDLEVAIRPEKASARARTSIQTDLDAAAVKEYLRQLDKLRAKREKASDDVDPAEVARLDDEIGEIEAELKKNGHASDAGEQARGNVSKAIAATVRKLRKGSANEKAFAAHIEQFVDTGYQCVYNQAQGRIWQ